MPVLRFDRPGVHVAAAGVGSVVAAGPIFAHLIRQAAARTAKHNAIVGIAGAKHERQRRGAGNRVALEVSARAGGGRGAADRFADIAGGVADERLPEIALVHLRQDQNHPILIEVGIVRGFNRRQTERAVPSRQTELGGKMPNDV